MASNLRFRHNLRVEQLGSEVAFLFSEQRAYFLQDPVEQLLAFFINQGLSEDEIVQSVLEHFPSTASSSQEKLHEFIQASAPIYYALEVLKKAGHLIEDSNPLPPELTVLCEFLNVSLETAQHRLTSTPVLVKTIGLEPAIESAFVASLKSMHIAVTSASQRLNDGASPSAHSFADESASDESANLEVVLTDDYLREDLADLNQRHLKSKCPWMVVKPVGTLLWLGPIFSPEKTGCWDCLAQRLRINRPIESYLARFQGKPAPFVPPNCVAPSTIQTAFGLAATEIFKWIVQGSNPRLEGNLLTLDTLSIKTRDHTLVRRPQCLSCGDSDWRQHPAQTVLGNRKKTFTADGGHRCVSPEETLAKYQHHISPITGIVRKIESVSPSSHGMMHSYLVRHHFSRMFDDFNALYHNLSGMSAGKGRTDRQAQASGLGEAFERYSGTFQGTEPRIKNSYQHLGDCAIHPNACMNFSQKQYEQRQEWNETSKSFYQRVPEPFEEEEEIEWTPVWSLSEKRFKYLPTAYCYFGYPKPDRPSCWADANGCAAGNVIEEAILHGFMELVERDSVALWWYNRLQKPEVDLDSFELPYFQDLKTYYQTLNRELWVLDVTSDLNIPTFVAVSRRCDRTPEDIIFGFGTHLDPAIAISRALTELNQLFVAVSHANPDGSTQYPTFIDPMALEWWTTATLDNKPYLLPQKTAAPKRSSDYPRTWSDNLLDDIQLCQSIVESKRMEMLVLDQTQPDVGMKVVKVIVPGMRHFWKRLGPGRLYKIPIQMGWLTTPFPEDQLNPFPMWM